MQRPTDEQLAFRAINALCEVYSLEEAKLWLITPQRELEGDTPMSAIRAGNEEDVFKMIAAILHRSWGCASTRH